MSWELSKFGQGLCSGSGIGELMDDLGHALAKGKGRVRMLGGGQPAHIPEMAAIWRRRMEEILAKEGALEHMVGNYEPPAGNHGFRESLADLFRRELGWEIGPENVGITMGGQTAFFFLFNALAGFFPDGRRKKILLPLVPEYIGYANQSIGGEIFRAVKPRIEITGDHEFKYGYSYRLAEASSSGGMSGGAVAIFIAGEPFETWVQGTGVDNYRGQRHSFYFGDTWSLKRWRPSPPLRTVKTPSGTPASLRSSATNSEALGSFSDGLRMNVFPAAIAFGYIHIGTIAGKLKGVIPATTPSGCLVEYTSTSVDACWEKDPLRCSASPQAYSMFSMPLWTSPRESESTFPCSAVN